MSSFLEEIFTAHGGLDRWRRFSKVEADIVTRGSLFPPDGMMSDVNARRMAISLKEEHASVQLLGAPDQCAGASPEPLAIERLNEAMAAERPCRKNGSVGQGPGMTWGWGPVHRAYSNGDALWTYLNTPFLLHWECAEVEEERPWREGGEVWRVLVAYFPGRIISHCAPQRFYFGPDGLLRRHDYHVDLAGGFAAAQLTTDYIEADGLKLPSRRRAFLMGPGRRPIPGLFIVGIDLSNVTFS